MQPELENNQLQGFSVKQKNDKRIAVGIHRSGLSQILARAGVSPEDIEKSLRGAKDWVNISFIRRDRVHPAGFTHFVVGDLKREEVVNG